MSDGSPLRRTFLPLPLSAAALARIDRVTRSLCGPFSDEKLVESVRTLSRIYTRERGQMASLPSDHAALLARAAFFLPRDLAKTFGPLDELSALGRAPLRERMRVLDVGAGLGATSFGLSRWLRLRQSRTSALEIVAVEQSASALRALSALATELSTLPDEFVPMHVEPQACDLRALRGTGFDVILFGFVLNELFRERPERERSERRAELLVQACARLGERWGWHLWIVATK